MVNSISLSDQDALGDIQHQLNVKAEGNVLERIGKGISIGVGEYGRDIAEQATIAATPYAQATSAGIQSLMSGDGILNSATVFKDQLDASLEQWNDPSWDPQNNKLHADMYHYAVQDAGLAPQNIYAQEILKNSTSELDMFTRFADLKDERSNLETLSNLGIGGTAAYMLSSAIDIDTAIGFGAFKTATTATKVSRIEKAFTNAGFDVLLTADEVAKVARVGTRLENMGAGALAAAVPAGALEIAAEYTDPMHAAENFIFAVGGAGVLGSTLGGFIKPLDLDVVATDIALRRGMVYRTDTKPRVDPERSAMVDAHAAQYRENVDTMYTMDLDASVGAAMVQRDGIQLNVSDPVKNVLDITEESLQMDANLIDAIRSLRGDWAEGNSKLQDAVQASGERINGLFSKVGLEPVFERNMRTDNAVIQYLTAKMLSDPLGAVVNHNSADAFIRQFEHQLHSTYAPHVPTMLDTYAKEMGVQKSDVFSIPKSGEVRTKFSQDVQSKFSSDVFRYMQYAAAGDTVSMSRFPQSVKDMAALVDQTNSKLLDIHHKYGVDDFVDVTHEPMHTSHKWARDKLLSKVYAGKSEALIKGLEQAIIRKAPHIDAQTAHIYAWSIVDSNIHAKSFMGSLGTITDEGLDTLTRGFKDLYGLSDADAAQAAKAAMYENSDRGLMKAARKRIPIDTTADLGLGDGTLVMDLLDQDVLGSLASSVRGQSAEAARVAATGGLLQRRDLGIWRRAVETDAQLRGASPDDVDKELKYFDQMMSEFTEGAYYGGVSANVQRILHATGLSLLGQNGFAQMAELGLQAGHLGVSAYFKEFGNQFKMAFSKLDATKDAELLNSLQFSDRYLTPNELTMVAASDMDMVSGIRKGKLDHMLRSASRIMSYTSMLHHTHALQQRTSYVLGASLMSKYARNPAKYSNRRLLVNGVDDEIIRIYNDNADAFKFDADDALTQIDFATFKNADDATTFKRALQRQVDWMVQKRRRGEERAWEYSDIGALMASMRGFPLTALYSKSLRGLRTADVQTAEAFLTNTLFSALVFAAKETVNGKYDKLGDPAYIAAGAMNWSAQWSPMAMLLSPAYFAAGGDYLLGSMMYSDMYKRGALGSPLTPAPLTVLGGYSEMARAGVDLLTDGDLDYRSIQALQMMPVIGRLPGVRNTLMLLHEK